MQASWDYTRGTEHNHGDGWYISGDVEIAFEEGARWADKSRSWRACAAGLPEQRGQYLVATKRGIYVAEFIPKHESNEIFPAGWHIFTGVLADVTHWKQIPDNPNKPTTH